MSRFLALLSAVALGACATTVPATGVVVELDAEPSIRGEAREVVIVVRGGPRNDLAVRHEETLRGADLVWPIRVSIAPEGGDVQRAFAIEATARDAGGDAIGAVRASSGFVARRTLFVRLAFEGCCRATVCDDDETCFSCGCAPSHLEPSTLGDFRATDAGTSLDDASAPDGDAAVDAAIDVGSDAAMDAGIEGNDAATGDAAMPPLDDGGVPADAPPLVCEDGWADCNGSPSDGCEASLDSLAHCGACGAACVVSNGVGACTARTCTIDSCAAGRADCDGIVSTGCEVDTVHDPAHCGSCSRSCAATSATVACVASSCAVVACDPGRGNCDDTASTGCETDTTTLANCGACGRSCVLRGTNRTCSGGACASTGCMAGFTDCSAAVEGCEAYLANDRNNCGVCGRVCGGGDWCSNGGCCPLGLDFCPGAGCVNTASDRNHCGSCTNVCGGALTCFDYECV